MRTAILSDIHGNDVAFEAVVKDMEANKVNNVIFLGDLVAVGPQPLEAYNRLMSLDLLAVVKGNTDAWLDDALIDTIPKSPKEIELLNYYDYMSHKLTGRIMDDMIALPKSKVVNLGHYSVLCVHGSVKDYSDKILEGDKGAIDGQLEGVTTSAVLSGHTHQQHDFTHRTHRMINPGAVGTFNQGKASIEEGKKASYAIIDTYQGFNVSYHTVAYDHQVLLDIAKERQFPNMEDYIRRLSQ